MLITCSNCQSKIKVPDSAAGKKGKCPKCGTIITIPAQESPSEDPTVAVQGGGSPFDFDEPAPAPSKGKSRAADDDEPDVTDEDADADADTRRPKKTESVGLSVTSLVLGIVSLLSGTVGGCCCSIFSAPLTFLLAVGAIVCGLLGMNKGGKVMAIIGMCLGGVSLLLFILWIVLFFLGVGLNVMGNMGAAGGGPGGFKFK